MKPIGRHSSYIEVLERIHSCFRYHHFSALPYHNPRQFLQISPTTNFESAEQYLCEFCREISHAKCSAIHRYNQLLAENSKQP